MPYSFPPKDPHLTMPASHLPELSNDDLLEVRSCNAPAAMYFVIWVFPISMTSGAFPPARVASNFARFVVHCWYWTLTSTPGWSFLNCALVEATRSGQPFCASVCNQTVMLFAEVLLGAAVAAVTVTASAATRPTAAR